MYWNILMTPLEWNQKVFTASGFMLSTATDLDGWMWPMNPMNVCNISSWFRISLIEPVGECEVYVSQSTRLIYLACCLSPTSSIPSNPTSQHLHIRHSLITWVRRNTFLFLSRQGCNRTTLVRGKCVYCIVLDYIINLKKKVSLINSSFCIPL